MKTSIISLLGSTLDAHGPRGKDRWNVWRPNVALAMQEDLHFDEFHLLYQSQFQGLAQLREVVATYRESRSAAEAGKRLFAVSRKAKKTTNDTDRLAKYLAKFGLSFKAVAAP